MIKRLFFNTKCLSNAGPSGYEATFGKIPEQKRNVDKPSENMANPNVICTGTTQPSNTIFSGPWHLYFFFKHL